MQVFSSIFSAALGFIVLSGAVGCKTTDKDKENAADALQDVTAPMTIPVGSLHVVRPEEGFVLIRSSRFFQIEPGTDIITYGNGGTETSRLRVSPAKKGQFVTADILSGSPKVGDQAVMDYAVARPGDGATTPGVGGDDEIQVLE